MPVFVPDEAGGERFWGFAIAVIRFPELLEASHLGQLVEHGYDYELSRIHPDSGERVVFARSAEAELRDAMPFDIDVPSGRWTLSLAPRGGWQSSSTFVLEAVLVFLSGLLVVWPTYTLVQQPETLRREVAWRTQELSRANQELVTEILERERKTGQHLPIIAMTAYAMKGDQERCLAAGMDGYIAKPLRVEALYTLIDQLLPGASAPSLPAVAPPIDLPTALQAGVSWPAPDPYFPNQPRTAHRIPDRYEAPVSGPAHPPHVDTVSSGQLCLRRDTMPRLGTIRKRLSFIRSFMYIMRAEGVFRRAGSDLISTGHQAESQGSSIAHIRRRSCCMRLNVVTSRSPSSGMPCFRGVCAPSESPTFSNLRSSCAMPT